MGPEKEL
nr:unknown [Zea mays]